MSLNCCLLLNHLTLTCNILYHIILIAFEVSTQMCTIVLNDSIEINVIFELKLNWKWIVWIIIGWSFFICARHDWVKFRNKTFDDFQCFLMILIIGSVSNIIDWPFLISAWCEWMKVRYKTLMIFNMILCDFDIELYIRTRGRTGLYAKTAIF